MALILQRNVVPLIGGKELPKASGQGARAPDLSGIHQFAGALQRKQAESRGVQDKIDATNYMEAWRKDMLVGKGADGMYKALPPLPPGSPAFQAAAFEVRAANAKADIYGNITKQLNDIQGKWGEPSAVRVQKMQSAVEGMVSSLDPLLQNSAREDAIRELEQRKQQMFSEDQAKEKAVTQDAWKTRETRHSDLAVSAVEAGGSADRDLDEVRKVKQEQVQLGYKDQATADTEMGDLTEKVHAYGTVSEITRLGLRGGLTYDQIDGLGLVLQNGTDEDVRIEGVDQSAPPPPDRFGGSGATAIQHEAGIAEIASAKVYSSQEIAKAIANPDVRKAMGNDLRRLAQFLKENYNRKDEMADFQRMYDQIAETDNQAPASFSDTQEKMLSNLVVNGGMDDPNGRVIARKIITGTKRMSASVSGWMINSLDSNDPSKAAEAASFWYSVRNARRQGAPATTTEVGSIIARDMKEQDVARLDAAANSFAAIVKSGDDRSLEAWHKGMKEINRDEYKLSTLIERYNRDTKGLLSTAPSYDTAFENYWIDQFGPAGSIPAEAKDNFNATYQVLMATTPQITVQQAFEQAWTATSERWHASDIYWGGLQATRYEPSAPPGYGTRTTINPFSSGTWENPIISPQAGNADTRWGIPTPRAATQWTNDYVVNLLGKLDDSNGLVFHDTDEDSTERNAFETIMADPLTAFGQGRGKLTLKATRGNREYAQFNVVMTLPDGSTTVLQQRDSKGNLVPVLVDPHTVNAHLQSKAQAEEANQKFWSDIKRERNSTLDRQLMDTEGDPYRRGAENLRPSDWDDETVDEFIGKQDAAFKQKMKDFDIHAGDAYKITKAKNDAKVVQVPAGTDIAPELLNQSKVGGVDATIGAISTVGKLLGDDYNTQQFMLDTATVESDAGQHPDTFRRSGDRGIFQVNDGTMGAYREIRRRANIQGDVINIAATKLKAAGIDIANASPDDLDKPLVGAAFARLYYMADPRPITADPARNGEIWKDHYNTNLGAGSVNGFVQVAGKYKMPTEAVAAIDTMSTGSAPSGGGIIIDSGSGEQNPAQFRGLKPGTQAKAQQLASVWGEPLRITPHGGMSARASGGSQHPHGTAMDIYVADWPDEKKKKFLITAISLGFRGIGGYSAGDGVGTVHIDLRARDGNGPQGLSTWWRHRAGVDDSYTTAPAWFRSAIDEGGAILRSRTNG